MSTTKLECPKDLGAILRVGRHMQGLSQARLARQLGISTRYIGEMEAGKPSLFTDRLFACIEVLPVGLVGVVLDGRLLDAPVPPPSPSPGVKTRVLHLG